MSYWNITLLGKVSVRFGESEVTRFDSNRVVALLARLALFPERIHPREELIELLWPEVDPVAGRNRFRNTLSSLRRQLELPSRTGDLFIVDRHSLRLNPEAFTCDVGELKRAIKQREWEKVKELHQGELLLGFYDDWILTEREHIETLCENLPEGDKSENPKPEPALLTHMPRLPAYLTAFFGREPERDALENLLKTQRLVTITGPGGMGKTRLSVEVARTLAPQFERCAFVALAECFEPGGLIERIRSGLGVQGSNNFAEALADQKTLLVLDNFEQLLDGGGSVVIADLLSRLPLLTCLVTSRRTLGIGGEQEWALAALPLPTEDEPTGAGLSLFVDRARAVRPSFALSERNQADLWAISKLLEGVPLAIELVASRIRVFSLAELQTQLTKHFAPLAHAPLRGNKDERHRSLHATVDWSWRLLAPRLQHFLVALSVFRGGWSADAAMAVCDAPDAHFLLEELVADSLVVATEMPDGTMRFRLLEMIRSFLEEQLAPTRRAELQEAHGAYFAEWYKEMGHQWHVMGMETENLLIALERAIETQNTSRTLLLARPVRVVLGVARKGESRPLLQRALALPDVAPQERCKILINLFDLCIHAGEWKDAQTYFDEAKSLQTNNAECEMLLLRAEIISLLDHDQLEGVGERLEKALSLARKLGDQGVEAGILNMSGHLAQNSGNFEQAIAFYQQSESLYTSTNNLLHANDISLNRAGTLGMMKRVDEALELYEKASQIYLSFNIPSSIVGIMGIDNNMGILFGSIKQWDKAVFYLQECIKKAWRLHSRYMLVLSFLTITEPLAHLNQHEKAAQIMGFAEHFWVTDFSELTNEYKEAIQTVRTLCTTQIGATKTETLFEKGKAMSLRDAVLLALR
jgi:predicted ATPase